MRLRRRDKPKIPPIATKPRVGENSKGTDAEVAEKVTPAKPSPLPTIVLSLSKLNREQSTEHPKPAVKFILSWSKPSPLPSSFS